MELTAMLGDMSFCRLCCEETRNGSEIFTSENNEQDLWEIINKYLPLKIKKGEKLPSKICSGCRIQLDATKSFLDLIIAGQIKLKQLYKQQQEKLYRQEKQRQQLENALHTVNPSSTVDTYTIESDETGEKFLIQIFSPGPLFPPDHEMSLRTEGLEKPKRRRGRPSKTHKNTEPESVNEKTIEIERFSEEGMKKRRIKVPSRFSEAIQGKELDKIYKEEGVLDEELSGDSISEKDDGAKESKCAEEIIGRVENDAGEDLGERIVLNKVPANKTKPRNMQIRKKRTFQCEICKRDFLHRGRYELHKKSHLVEYICGAEECNFICDEYSLMEQHQVETGHTGINATEQVSEFGTFILPVETAAENSDNPATTMEQKVPVTTSPSSGNKICCDKCGKKFSCKQNYETHVKAVHYGLRPFVCEFCNVRFPYAKSLRLHLLKHSLNREEESEKSPQFKCLTCGKVFKHPSSLQYHRDSIHADGRRFVCNKCDKAFKHRQLLKRHQLVHSEERPYNCFDCNAAFKTSANLIHHKRTVHSIQKSHWCQQCGKSFTHKTALKLHLQWHAGIRPYQCEFCQKKFSQKGNLAEHRRIHTGEKPYQCDNCGRSFTTSSQFRLHRKRHLNEKPHQCSHCLKSFLHKVTLRCHMRRHLNQNPFKCKECEKTFPEAWALRKHERLHTGEKPYRCDTCGKRFADSSNLNKHKRTHQNAKEKNLKQMVYITYDKDDAIVTYIEPEVPENVPALENELGVEITEQTIQIQHLLDHDGNAISFTTPDGQLVKVVSSIEDGQSNIQGLLPDGTLIPIDLTTQDKNLSDEDSQVDTILEDQILPTNMELLTEDSSKVQNNIQFITEDTSNMCLVTTFNIEDTINPQYLSMT